MNKNMFAAVEERKGDWINTHSGFAFYPLDPRPTEVCIEDIAHALSLTCRFTGHCARFYSVAEHSLHVAKGVAAMGGSASAQLIGLLHDASEAYLVDVARPVKVQPEMAAYRLAEQRVQDVVFTRFGLRVSQDDHRAKLVHEIDNDMLSMESEELIPRKPRAWSLSQRKHLLSACDNKKWTWFHKGETTPVFPLSRGPYQADDLARFTPLEAEGAFLRTFDALFTRCEREGFGA